MRMVIAVPYEMMELLYRKYVRVFCDDLLCIPSIILSIYGNRWTEMFLFLLSSVQCLAGKIFKLVLIVMTFR